MHTGIRDNDAWEKAERDAETVATAIDARLRRPTWHLFATLDPALWLRLVRLRKDQQLASANGLLLSDANSIASHNWFAGDMRPGPFTTPAASMLIWLREKEERIADFYRRVRRTVFGSVAQPRIWNLSYSYSRSLWTDTKKMIQNTEKILTISEDISSSHIYAKLHSAGHDLTVATPTAGVESVYLISKVTNAPIAPSSQSFVVIDRALFIGRSIDAVIKESYRVLKPGGRLLVFANHIAPDSRSESNLFFGTDAIARLLRPNFQVLEQRTQGATGSVVGHILGQGFGFKLTLWPWTRKLLKLLLLPLIPLWILLGLLANLVVRLLDKVDKSGQMYVTSLTLAVREDTDRGSAFEPRVLA